MNIEPSEFLWELIIPPNYPFSPPIAYNLDKISHENISPINGKADLSCLTDRWSPVLTLKSVVYALKLFLVGGLEDFEPQVFLEKDSKNKARLDENSKNLTVRFLIKIKQFGYNFNYWNFIKISIFSYNTYHKQGTNYIHIAVQLYEYGKQVKEKKDGSDRD